ncbi:MAG: nuclear transport factor 2 family protein [Solirubrobacterales bacterium]
MSDRADAVRAMIEAFNAADSDALRRSLHPEIIVRRPLPDVGIPSHPSDAGSYHGLREVIRELNHLIERVGGIEVEVRTLEEVGEDGVVFEFLALIGPASERTAQLGWSYFRFKDGLIVSTETFATESAARRAIGG